MAIDRAKKDEEIDVEEVLNELEHKVERLKILYEQYFMGIEKIEPQTGRKEVTRKLLELTQLNIRNTALRYRFHAMNQKFGVYQTYWNRTLREIEQGTYYRSIARAGRDAARRGVDMPDEVLRALPTRLRERIIRDRERLAKKEAGAASAVPQPVPADDTERMPAMAGPPPGKEPSFDATFDRLFDTMTGSGDPPRPKPPAPATLPPGMDEARVRELHRQYQQAKLALGEEVAVRYEQILATVVKQGAKVIEQFNAKSVDFAVVMRDGKVILKATPKR